MANEPLIDDLVITDDELYCNNTFSLKALNETLERLSVTNFWSLYQTQRSRLRMNRFDIPFNDFLYTKRLMGETKLSYYPKRYISYVDYTFIEPELRKRYRNSEFYNLPLNQKTISENPDLFTTNFLVFINGDFIYTSEIYPLESKLGVIIDLESKNNNHGLTTQQYLEYRESNPTVTILLIPNYGITDINTNKFMLTDMHYEIPFNRIKESDKLNDTTLCFVNTVDGLARRYYEAGVYVNEQTKTIEIDKNITPGGNLYRFSFITFNQLLDSIDISYDNPFFRLSTKMPCPIEQMIVFVEDEEGRYMFKDLNIDLFYPNIYKVNGLNEGEEACVFIFQDEEELTKDEKYVNEIAKYEEYVNLMPKFRDDSIPEILKHYKPSSYVYSIDDYKNSMYIPSTLNYKVQKLHKTIYENPWALAVYLDLLNLPTDKFYLDMTEFDLSERVRRDTTQEKLDEVVVDIEFDEDMYVFAMNRHFVSMKSYGFRIFIDGLFQTDDMYTILPGPDFYYIYIPTSKVNEDSMIEIERYKLFAFEHEVIANSLDEPIIELNLKDKESIGYSREIYMVDVETNLYLKKDKDIRIDVLYRFAEGGDKWVTIPSGRNIPIENKVRIYLKNIEYLNKPLRIGINRSLVMVTGEPYVTPQDELHDITIFDYQQLKMLNMGNYDLGNYRLFNNGRLLLPVQYFMHLSRYQGEKDVFKTSCDLFDGDKFTMDRTPAWFTVVYYQNEVDMENKKGLVDLDGKVELPISLKWYDIYLNGIKLHKNNIEIISPTKFYIKNIDSRKHLVILMKNRDPEIFKLATHKEGDFVDYNNTIMDELMSEIGGLREIIDGTKDVIDPNNETHQIAYNIAANINALIFFFEYLVYTFINANYKQLTQEIKDAFPMLINDKGIMEIDPNHGCIESNEIAGYLIKLIQCNYEDDERGDDMFTGKNVSYDGLGILQDRFAIRPLDTTNYEYGLPKEFMCDPETGEPAIMNDDGTVTTVSTLFRVKNFIADFSENIMMYGMGKADIYQITFDNEYKVLVYKDGENLLTEDISTEKPIRKFALGLDATFLNRVGESKMLKVADVDPMVEVVYLDGEEEKSFRHSINRLHNYIIESNKNIITLKSIKLIGIPDNIKTFIHSLLIAF